MAKTAASKKAKATKKVDTTMAIVAYILFFVPLLTDAKNDAFVMFHAKQSLVLLLSWVGVSIVSMIFPPLGLLNLFLFVLWIIGVLNAVNGEKKELPVIGQYASKINL